MNTRVDANWDKGWRDSQYRLRFDLGGDLSNITQTVPRFLQAFDRARTIADALFSDIGDVIAIVAACDSESPLRPFQALQAMGFSGDLVGDWQARYWRDDPETDDFVFHAYRPTDKAARDTLLWASVSQEMGVTPKAPARIHLISMDSSIDLLVYDDRGMDITSADAATIAPIYSQFEAWILDYDRPRIRAAFGF